VNSSTLRSLVRLLCVVVATMALTVAPSSAFADDPPGTPGDTTGTGTGTDGDDEVDGGDNVEGEDSAPGDSTGEVDEGNGAEVVTGGPDPAGGGQVETDAGSEVVSGGNGAISVGGADAIQRDDGAPAIGVRITASPAGDVQLRVRSYVAEEAVVGSQATIFVNVLTDDEHDETSTDGSDEESDDGSAKVALPETGASGNLQPMLAAGIYFTLAGLIVVAATKRHEILVPTTVVRRRRPRVNWE